MGCALALVALGVGYIVLLQANKEKEGLKLLGQAIGILILIGAVLSALCSSMKCAKGGGACATDKKMCAVTDKGAMCPVTGKPMAAPAAE